MELIEIRLSFSDQVSPTLDSGRIYLEIPITPLLKNI